MYDPGLVLYIESDEKIGFSKTIEEQTSQRKFENSNIKAPWRKFMFPNIKFGHSLFGLSRFQSS